MSNPFVGEIRAFAFNFPPRGWALCNGQLLSISENQALFALIGTFYGGDGSKTFGLPNLQGRVAVHQTNGFVLGQAGGSSSVTLTQTQLPPHNHSVTADAAGGSAKSPAGAFLAEFNNGSVPLWRGGMFAPKATEPVAMANNMIGVAGGGQPFSVQNPYLVLNFCIALLGIFPTRS
ncbi:phage tail protein [Methylocystis heyeri]|uniref:Phage tail protein n=1 Tax=Methylocystis heyeri TaxID=391905 RepID=A0A6B8KH84_9HYPH|nr:tail fiber protein [Methylocystis heyeri]QGM46351.1 phage tail protein [Methylocystis heyeri]